MSDYKTETFVSTFPQGREYLVENKVAQINKRAKRMKVKPLTLTISEPRRGTWSYIVEGAYGKPESVDYECNLVTATVVCEQEIKLEGEHTLLAVFENVEGNAFITSLVDGNDFAEYREGTKAFVCDHCGHSRQRKKCVLIEKNGEQLVIGSTCVRDYLGYEPSLALSSVGFLRDARKEFDDEEEFRGSTTKGALFEDITKLTLHVLAGANWKYEKEDNFDGTKFATAGIVSFLLGEGGFRAIKDKFKYEELAESVMTYFNGLNDKFLAGDHLSDYDYKIAVLAGANYIDVKHTKMVAGAVSSYIRKTRVVETMERGVSEHIGNIGDKIAEMDLEVTRIHTFMDHSYSFYGQEKTIVSGFINGKDKFTWFTSPSAAEKAGMTCIEEGLEVPAKGILKVKGTVKDHKNDQYGISTVFTRVSQVKPKKAKK